VRFWRRRLVALGLAALLVAAAVALAADGPRGAQDGKGRAGGLPGATATAAAARDGLPADLDQAAARLMLVGFAGTDSRAPFLDRLRRTEWGGVVLERSNYLGSRQLAALTGSLRRVARQAGHEAPLVGAVQLGGEDSAFPDLGPEPQAATKDAADAGAQATTAGRRLAAAGVRLTLAPAADLGSGGGAWEGRAFSDQPAAVAGDVRAAVDGYRRAGVAAAVGHYPGEGAASGDPGIEPATVGLSLDELRAADLKPFAAVARTAPAVQMSGAMYAAWDGVTPATLLPEAVALLRRQGFRGAVVSADLNAVTGVTGGSTAQAAVQALKAGCDLLYVPGDAADQEATRAAVATAIRRGDVSAARVSDALQHAAVLRRQFAVR
jgi:beta-N-acetylhexosaminidase